MSDTVPKERQTAYQRWEMASFGEVEASPQESVQQQIDTEALLAEAREQIAAAREQARREGLAEGLAQGYQTGMEQGRAQALEENTLLQQLSLAFGAEIAHAKELVAQDLLDLAKAMLKTVLAVQPERVLPIVNEAIGYLPTLQQPALLFLNPDDALLVRERMGAELAGAGWRVLDEAAMERGGCRVETATNQIDAATSSRWQRIAASLGKEGQWLA